MAYPLRFLLQRVGPFWSVGAHPRVGRVGLGLAFPRLGFAMPVGLKRIYGQRRLHFIAFGCCWRLPLLKIVRARDVFVRTCLINGVRMIEECPQGLKPNFLRLKCRS